MDVVESTEYLRDQLDGGENEIGLVGGLECVVLGSDEHLVAWSGWRESG